MSKEKYGYEININFGLFGEHYVTDSKILVAWTDPFEFKFKPTTKIDGKFIQTSKFQFWVDP